MMIKATWFSQRHIILREEIVAETAAGIAHITILMYRNLSVQNYFQRNNMTRSKKITNREKISRLNPSGKKEESFFDLVYEVVRQIPKGRVTSYGAIAACLGTKLSARMVGWAMHGAHSIKPKVPAHRVVNRNGMLSGKHHFETPTQMEELLKKEGIIVKNDTIQNFEKIFWDPVNETLS
jgi:methylated-DNA-protein-cysteine methyltransferase-like protein